MPFVHQDKTGVFSQAQKESLIEAASVRLSTTVVAGGVVALQADLHAGQKLQTHLHSFRYYSEAQWVVWFSLATMLTKFRDMSRIWLGWGLIYPSGPTFRVGLATIIVASGSVVSSTTAHEQLEEFKTEFKIIRGARPTKGTLKIVPSQAMAFNLLYPERLPSYVDCRADSTLIEEHACKEHIPIKANNAPARPLRPKLVLLQVDRTETSCRRC